MVDWIFKDETPKDIEGWLKTELSGSTANGPVDTPLAIEVNGTEAYAAVETKRPEGSRSIKGYAILMRFPGRQNGKEFSFCVMPEEMGPAVDNCPPHILRLLSETGDEFAIHWRTRCMLNHRHPGYGNKLSLGDIIRLNEPLKIKHHEPHDTFRVADVGKQFIFEALSKETGEPIFTCRIPGYQRQNVTRIEEDEVVITESGSTPTI